MITLFYDTFSTHHGLFSAAVDSDGAVHATAFGDVKALRPRLRSEREAELRHEPARLRSIRAQVLAFFAGSRTTFELLLRPPGTPFQQRVWNELQAIPYGTTTSYGALAAKLGSGPRAIGSANGANPICLIIPCHRVIGASGALTGFAFGEDTKRQLLELEAQFAATPIPAR